MAGLEDVATDIVEAHAGGADRLGSHQWSWLCAVQCVTTALRNDRPVREAETTVRWLLSGHIDAKAQALSWLAAYAHNDTTAQVENHKHIGRDAGEP